MPRQVQRVLVIGLDCATPRFLFGREAFDVPNLKGLAESGAWTTLRSCDPPITVPAWACMTTGCDPGTLGCYGFRNRPDYSYAPLQMADATNIREPRVWDLLGEAGLTSVCVGIPQTYPPAPLNGHLVSGILTPAHSNAYTYPKSLAAELEAATGPVQFDIADYRTDDKAALLKRLHAFLNNRFDVAEYLVQSKPWDFFMMVDMGVDRLHHAFWKHCDPDHPKFEAGNTFETAFADYYAALDDRIGALLRHVPDDTAVMVVSDHGARALEGGLCINQWLIDEGYLTVEDDLREPKRLEDCTIDWDRTTAWATGGYVSRVYLNIKGREPNGIIPPDEVDSFRHTLSTRLETIAGPDGDTIGNAVRLPDQTYQECNGTPPDLLVYCSALRLRAIGTVGYDSIFASENDTGPDDANHDFEGVFAASANLAAPGVPLDSMSLLDVAPTILDLLGVAIPETMHGTSIAASVAV
jgi:predicted AlkP superfamily phosphohydrolase/phosphomutase